MATPTFTFLSFDDIPTSDYADASIAALQSVVLIGRFLIWSMVVGEI